MSTFVVPVKRIRAIDAHPNADAIELAVIDGYRSIVRKGQFSAGDLIAYIPEASVVPEWLLKRLGLWDEEKGCGRLSGKDGNRVKAVRLRGELSQGICYPVKTGTDGGAYLEADGQYVAVTEGQCVAEILGITKYEPPIPVSMQGEVFNAGQRVTVDFDVENFKSFPDVIKEGEDVIFTEKLHGSFTGVAILPFADAHPEAFGERKNILIFSKGLGAKGLCFKNNDANAKNLYVRSTRQLIANIDTLQRQEGYEGVLSPCFILGETYGRGVQDLAYGEEIGFRVFACVFGYRGTQSYQNWAFVEGSLKDALGYETVPVLYRGPFSLEIMNQYTRGETSLGAGHIREGIVITPSSERYHPNIGRVCLKSISPDYLTRKNGTEYT